MRSTPKTAYGLSTALDRRGSVYERDKSLGGWGSMAGINKINAPLVSPVAVAKDAVVDLTQKVGGALQSGGQQIANTFSKSPLGVLVAHDIGNVAKVATGKAPDLGQPKEFVGSVKDALGRAGRQLSPFPEARIEGGKLALGEYNRSFSPMIADLKKVGVEPDIIKVYRGLKPGGQINANGQEFWTENPEYAKKYGSEMLSGDLDRTSVFDTRNPEHASILKEINKDISFRSSPNEKIFLDPKNKLPSYIDDWRLEMELKERGFNFKGLALSENNEISYKLFSPLEVNPTTPIDKLMGEEKIMYRGGSQNLTESLKTGDPVQGRFGSAVYLVDDVPTAQKYHPNISKIKVSDNVKVFDTTKTIDELLDEFGSKKLTNILGKRNNDYLMQFIEENGLSDDAIGKIRLTDVYVDEPDLVGLTGGLQIRGQYLRSRLEKAGFDGVRYIDQGQGSPAVALFNEAKAKLLK